MATDLGPWPGLSRQMMGLLHFQPGPVHRYHNVFSGATIHLVLKVAYNYISVYKRKKKKWEYGQMSQNTPDEMSKRTLRHFHSSDSAIHPVAQVINTLAFLSSLILNLWANRWPLLSKGISSPTIAHHLLLLSLTGPHPPHPASPITTDSYSSSPFIR